MKKVLCILQLLLATQVLATEDMTNIAERCASDELNLVEASARNEWARKCFAQVGENLDFFTKTNRTGYVLVQHKNGNWKGPLDPTASCDGWKLKAFCLAKLD